jgi:hypothetical protein
MNQEQNLFCKKIMRRNYTSYGNNGCLVNYKKMVSSGGNDPTISKAMRYSQYVRSSRSQPVSYSQYSQMFLHT